MPASYIPSTSTPLQHAGLLYQHAGFLLQQYQANHAKCMLQQLPWLCLSCQTVKATRNKIIDKTKQTQDTTL